MIKKLTSCIALFFLASTAQAAVLNVSTNFDECVSGAYCGANTLNGYLQNSANFGSPGAVVADRSFNIQQLGAGFTSSSLSGTDIFVASSKVSYSASQAAALYNFVMGGGNLFVYSDYAPTDAANANAVSNQFGVVFEDAFEIFNFAVQSGAGFVTSGPFAVGTNVTYARDAVSHITSLGSFATSVAQENPNSINSALINEGALGAGSGAVLFYSDWVSDVFQGAYTNASARNIILNFFTNVDAVPAASPNPGPTSVPEPSTLLLCALALGLMGFSGSKKSARSRNSAA